jgi:hypothetical protein
MYKLGFCIYGPTCRYRHVFARGEPLGGRRRRTRAARRIPAACRGGAAAGRRRPRGRWPAALSAGPPAEPASTGRADHLDPAAPTRQALPQSPRQWRRASQRSTATSTWWQVRGGAGGRASPPADVAPAGPTWLLSLRAPGGACAFSGPEQLGLQPTAPAAPPRRPPAGARQEGARRPGLGPGPGRPPPAPAGAGNAADPGGAAHAAPGLWWAGRAAASAAGPAAPPAAPAAPAAGAAAWAARPTARGLRRRRRGLPAAVLARWLGGGTEVVCGLVPRDPLLEGSSCLGCCQSL